MIRAKCCKCNKTSKNKEEVVRLFGRRTIRGRYVPEASCKACRNTMKRPSSWQLYLAALQEGA